MTDSAQAPASTDVFRVYRKWPNRAKKDLLLETNDGEAAENFAKSHDWDDTYETVITKNGVAVDRG